MTGWWESFAVQSAPPPPLKVTQRTLRQAVEEQLISAYTRVDLELVLRDELGLETPANRQWQEAGTKRVLIGEFVGDWTVPKLVSLARRIVEDLEAPAPQLVAMVAEYDRRHGGVTGTLKNLIFAANGPKPELVLRDAVNNDVEIVRNAQYCLVFDRPLPRDGLTYQTLIDWWRDRQQLDADDRAVGLSLHDRLRACLSSDAERVVFDAYQRRYKTLGFGIPALIPQVYLHYDPYTARTRADSLGPLARQRMDFLLLYNERRRVVLEVDGQHHYADDDGRASPSRYAAMVAEDRRLRLTGYDIYRFGGKELLGDDGALLTASFLEELHTRLL